MCQYLAVCGSCKIYRREQMSELKKLGQEVIRKNTVATIRGTRNAVVLQCGMAGCANRCVAHDRPSGSTFYGVYGFVSSKGDSICPTCFQATGRIRGRNKVAGKFGSLFGGALDRKVSTALPTLLSAQHPKALYPMTTSTSG